MRNSLLRTACNSASTRAATGLVYLIYNRIPFALASDMRKMSSSDRSSSCGPPSHSHPCIGACSLAGPPRHSSRSPRNPSSNSSSSLLLRRRPSPLCWPRDQEQGYREGRDAVHQGSRTDQLTSKVRQRLSQVPHELTSRLKRLLFVEQTVTTIQGMRQEGPARA